METILKKENPVGDQLNRVIAGNEVEEKPNRIVAGNQVKEKLQGKVTVPGRYSPRKAMEGRAADPNDGNAAPYAERIADRMAGEMAAKAAAEQQKKMEEAVETITKKVVEGD